MRATKVPPRVQEVVIGLAIVVYLTSTGVIDSWVKRSPPRADDLDLVSRVAALLVPPSSEPYNLSKPDEENWGQAKQVQIIQALTRNKTGGFFIETGAYDGEKMSNTLLLERSFGWTGVLIEPSRMMFPRLVQKRRRAWSLHACCSHTGAPFQAVFRDQAWFGMSSVEDGLSAQKVSDDVKRMYHPDTEIKKYPVECFPLYSILLALNQTAVDFFSLDVEGVEMGILAYLPWHILDIKIVLAETHLAHFWNAQSDQMRWFMEQQGYLAMHLMQDWLFVKRDSEYAREAQDIVRLKRQQTIGYGSVKKDGDKEVFYPFNY